MSQLRSCLTDARGMSLWQGSQSQIGRKEAGDRLTQPTFLAGSQYNTVKKDYGPKFNEKDFEGRSCMTHIIYKRSREAITSYDKYCTEQCTVQGSRLQLPTKSL